MHSQPPKLPERVFTLWGAAHLAWSVAIVLAILMAAQQTPVRWSSASDVLALATYLCGLAFLLMVGWLCADRGFRLRQPVKPQVVATKREFITYVGLTLLMGVCWWRGADSRLLAYGLDRLAAALFIVSLVCAVLWLVLQQLKQSLPNSAHGQLAGGWLAWCVWLLGTATVLALAFLELVRW
jgi:hypothetical protein